ncbi:MAG: DUF4253 domain-containing protein [Bacteroidia bacterium]|nr:DUF4253 domain-containing protein [Bacteroidia bacterium]MCF8425184.1 DUF4253 domain-containing protein [Bacteroidia bacterium]MCF8447776.1 DUF4253 domain-containing protein [Bacteroidia bacterium]
MGLFEKIFRKTKNKISFSADLLTDNEKQLCKNANLSEEDGMLLKKLTQRPIEVLKFEQEYSEIEKPNAICSLTSEENAEKIVLDNLEHFKKQGKYIFIFGIAQNGYIVGLTGATSDPYKLMELAETNGINYDIETNNIIERYKKWDNEFGIIPIGIGPDFCECKIKNRNIDFKKLAQEVYEFCPDVVDQGTETVDALEEEMKRTGTIYLWWD